MKMKTKVNMSSSYPSLIAVAKWKVTYILCKNYFFIRPVLDNKAVYHYCRSRSRVYPVDGLIHWAKVTFNIVSVVSSLCPVVVVTVNTRLSRRALQGIECNRNVMKCTHFYVRIDVMLMRDFNFIANSAVLMFIWRVYLCLHSILGMWRCALQ